jgi:hypothetical protein
MRTPFIALALAAIFGLNMAGGALARDFSFAEAIRALRGKYDVAYRSSPFGLLRGKVTFNARTKTFTQTATRRISGVTVREKATGRFRVRNTGLVVATGNVRVFQGTRLVAREPFRGRDKLSARRGGFNYEGIAFRR